MNVRFSVRSLFVACTLLCCAIGGIAFLRARAFHEKNAEEATLPLLEGWDVERQHVDSLAHLVLREGEESALDRISSVIWGEEFDWSQELNPAQLQELAACQYIRYGMLCYPTFGDQHAAALESWPRLERLVLTQTVITDQGMLSLSRCSSLRVLDVGGTGVTGAGWDAMSSMPRLLELDLTGTAVTCEGIDALSKKAARLEILRLAGTQIGSECVPALLKLVRLRVLLVAKTYLTRDDIKVLCAGLPRLTIVSLPDDAKQLEDDEAFLQQHPELGFGEY